ncbi:unnamed protein product [Phytomonas sp. Hart1]|nr:unnamed protein product [Phytomonas sp. Hart1]|eukprot:CCW67347.1 unnamed protein product [Phytomonas sp. isolate Hart1]
MSKSMAHQTRGLSSIQTECFLSELLGGNNENEAEDDIEDWKVGETVCNETVELMSSDFDESKSTATLTNMGWTASDTTSPIFAIASVETVHTLDPFARAKILNFIQRMLSLPSSSSSNTRDTDVVRNGSHEALDKSVYVPEVREVQGNPGFGKQYHATLRLPLPSEYGLRYGEGFASTERDAELVAAMHAERVLDKLGFHIYQLSSKQSRHAEAARKAGRWAPMPDEGERGLSRPPPTTSSPPSLQYVMENTTMSVSRQLQLDKVHFVNVTRGVFTPFKFTLASPYFLDFGSIKRIKYFFEAYKANINNFSKVIALHKNINKENKKHGDSECGSDQLSDDITETDHSFLAQLKLPIASRFGERVCMGIGPTKKEAIALVCMHAELTIDTLGLALYPISKEKQSLHVMECEKVQRWCAPVENFDFRYDAVSPPPLRILPGHTAAIHRGTSVSSSEADLTQHRRVGEYRIGGVPVFVAEGTGEKQHNENGRTMPHTIPLCDKFSGCITSTEPLIAELQNGDTSVESMLLKHSYAVKNFSCVQDVGSVDKSAKLLLDHYLDYYYHSKRFKDTKPLPGSPFGKDVLSPYLVECLGIKFHETYRATITVYLFASGGVCESGSSGQNDEARDKNATFTAIGIAKTHHEAEIAAATHALRVLTALNHPVVFSTESKFLLSSFIAALSKDSRQNSFQPYDPTKRVKELHEIASNPLCVPVRCIGKEHVGRIIIPGLSEKQLITTSENTGVTAAYHSSLTSSSRVFKILNQDATIMKALFQARKTLPKSDWSLEEDGNNRIVVNPASTRETGRGYIHTLPGVRTPDGFAINRLQDYLERHGKCLETSFIHSCHEVDDEGITIGQGSSTQANLAVPQSGGNGKKSLCPLLHVVKVILPVSQRFGRTSESDQGSVKGEDLKLPGRFIAHGEGYNEADALLMCAMHAELLLDTLGVPFYDHPVLQRKHIDTANMLGRQTAVGTTVKAPPPVRKEHPNSCLWARMQIHLAKESTTPSQPLFENSGVVETPTTVAFHSKPEMTAQTDIFFPNNLPGSSANGSDVTDSSSFEFTDDNLCDFSKLQPIHSTEVFRTSLKHIRHYFQQQGSDFFRMLRQYSVKTSCHGIVYRAIVEIPVPKIYNKRFAVGCASTKGRALNLCASHAIWTLDALNIPIYSGWAQTDYAKSSRLVGRRSPMPGDPLMPGYTPSPRGLCDMSVGAIERPDPPVLPSLEQIGRDAAVWTSYVRLCKIFYKKNEEITLHESLFQLHQAPRSGVEVEDKGLSSVELMPINNRAKHQLVRLCADVGLPRPDDFRYNIYTRASEKWFLVETPVLGTVFKARGLAQNPGDSILRAAMHYEYLIRTAVLPQRALSNTDKSFQSGRLVPTTGERSRRGMELFDSTKGDFSTQGKAAVLALYAATHRPYQPVQLILREGAVDPALPPVSLHTASKIANNNPRVGMHVVVTADLSDDLGLRHSAKGEHPSNVSEAIERASSGLFHLLQRKANIQFIGQVIKRHPSICMGTLCKLAFDKTDTGVVASDAMLISLCKAAKKIVDSAPFLSEEFILDELKGLPMEGSRDLLSSSYAVMLLDIVTRRLDQSTIHAPLTTSTFMCDNFAALGLLPKSVHEAASSKKLEPYETSKEKVTSIAGVVALLMQCIPRQASVGRQDFTLLNGPLLPIQLGKLLLAGFLFDCVPFTIRMAAMVMDLQRICVVNNHSHTFSGQEGEGGGQELQWHDWRSVDLVEEILHPSAPLLSSVTSYEIEIAMRLCELQTLVEKYVPASKLAGLFSPFRDLKEFQRQANHRHNEAMSKDSTFLETRLHMCVAFATYPQILTPKPESPRIVEGSIVLDAADPSITVLEPMDGAQQAYIKTVPHHPRAPFACFDTSLRSNTDTEKTVSSSEVDVQRKRKNHLPRQVGVGHAHICVAGSSVASVVNIVATVLSCNKHHVLSVQEEIPNLGLMLDGTLPLVFPSAAVMEAVCELQTVFAQSLSYLRSPPHDALHALDILLHSCESSNKP